MNDEIKKKIAIVLICYNHENFIIEALDGIRSQERIPNEVVIADDGSADGTQQLIREYVQKHDLQEKWLLLLSPKNRGINRNVQEAVNQTTADIIILMAGDDISLSNRCTVVEKMFQQNPAHLMIANSGYVIDEHGTTIREVAHPDLILDNIAEAIRHGNPRIMPVGNAMRREIFSHFGELPMDVPNEDDQLTFRGLISGGIIRSSVKTFKYRIHSQSASSWLHKKQSGSDFFKRFKTDIAVRARHMQYWSESLEKVQLENKFELIEMANLKAELYRALSVIDTTPLHTRIRYFFQYRRVFAMKDRVYCLFGGSGVRGWQRIRRFAGRA